MYSTLRKYIAKVEQTGKVSKDLIIGLEAEIPGVITDELPLGYFSEIPTETNAEYVIDKLTEKLVEPKE